MSLLAACALSVCLAASAAAAPVNWLDPAVLSKPGRDALNPAVVMDAAGNMVALWERQNTFNSSYSLQIATRPAGGALTAPAEFSPSSSAPQLAVLPSGEVVAAWKHFQNPLNTIQVATRPPGASTFGPPVTAYTAVENVLQSDVRLAVGDNGDIALTWSEIDPEAEFEKIICVPGLPPKRCSNPPFIKATVRPAGGSFTAAKRISPPRGVEEPLETELEKEEREKFESKLAAVGAQPAVDAAGNVTVVWSYFDGTYNIIQSSVREAGGEFTAPTQTSPAGKEAGLPDIDSDAAGNATAIWVRVEGGARVVDAAVRPPGGGFIPLGAISSASGIAEEPTIDVTDAGAATVVWRLSGLSETFLQAVTRPPGGAFGTPLNLSSGKDNPLFADLATNEAGDAMVVWNGDNGAGEIVRATVRLAGGSFGAPVAISQSSSELFHPDVANDAGGNGSVVWTRDNGSHSIVQWAGYDAQAPQLRDVSIPSLAKVGDEVRFSASASDTSPVGVPSFDFGDGGQASGNAVSHVYSAPGSHTVRVTAADAAGRTGTASGTILVKARNFFKIGKLKRNRRKGTATLSITIPEPGTLVGTAKGIKKATAKAAKGGTVKLKLKGGGKGLKRLNRKGKLKFRLKVAYSPVGGDTASQHRRLRLDKKLP
jgi:hypothetical protein